VIIAAIWQYSGYTMALYYAGLRGLPVEVHEWSKIDGATEFQYYFRVAIPMLRTTTFSAIIILAHISLKLFALIFAMTGVVSSVFRIFWGWLSDRIGRETTYTLGMISICMGVSSLLLINVTGSAGFVYTFSAFFGIGWGVTAPMFMAAAADLFRGKVFGLVYGIVEGAIGIGGAFGAWVAGAVFDRTQSYQWAFLLALVVFALSGAFMWLAALRKAMTQK